MKVALLSKYSLNLRFDKFEQLVWIILLHVTQVINLSCSSIGYLQYKQRVEKIKLSPRSVVTLPIYHKIKIKEIPISCLKFKGLHL